MFSYSYIRAYDIYLRFVLFVSIKKYVKNPREETIYMCEHINIFDTTNINHTSYVITSRYECSKSTVSFIYIFL